MYKKLIVFIILLCAGLAGCSEEKRSLEEIKVIEKSMGVGLPENMAQITYDNGMKVIAALDDYLDWEIDASEAYIKLETLRICTEVAVKKKDKRDTSIDLQYEINLEMLELTTTVTKAIDNIKWSDVPKFTDDDILIMRNELAVKLGEDEKVIE